MENMLFVGDCVIVSKLMFGLFLFECGEVVVFIDFGGWFVLSEVFWFDFGFVWFVFIFVGLLFNDFGNYFIKCVIGLFGDYVVCCDDYGCFIVNGVVLDELYFYLGDWFLEKIFDVMSFM